MQFSEAIALFLLFILFHSLTMDLIVADFVHQIRTNFVSHLWKQPMLSFKFFYSQSQEGKSMPCIPFAVSGIYFCDGEKG